jgi:hypothetical protein
MVETDVLGSRLGIPPSPQFVSLSFFEDSRGNILYANLLIEEFPRAKAQKGRKWAMKEIKIK